MKAEQKNIALSLLDGVLILLSFAAVGLELDPRIPHHVSDDNDRYISAALFFAGFLYLHWSFWRLLVPRGITEHSCARFPGWKRSRTGFFRDTITCGYVFVGIYCFDRAHSSSGAESPFPQFPFWMGLILILIGTASRSREVMLHLATKLVIEANEQDSRAKPFPNADAPALHGNS